MLLVIYPLKMRSLFITILVCEFSLAGFGQKIETQNSPDADGFKFLMEYNEEIESDPDSLLEYCFNPIHLKKYLNKGLTMNVLKSGSDFNVISYDFRYLTYYCQSIYFRQMHPENDSISFSLKGIYQNFPLQSNTISLKGYYKIGRNANGNANLQYYQVVELFPTNRENTIGIMNTMELHYLKKYMRTYIRNLTDYIETRNEKK